MEKYKENGKGLKKLLIRWATEKERCQYRYSDSIYDAYEVLAAIDRMIEYCLGVIGFSRKNKTVENAQIFDNSRSSEIEEILNKCAQRQSNPIGDSFHYKYTQYEKQSNEEYYPCCNNMPAPDGFIDIVNLDYSVVTAERKALQEVTGAIKINYEIHGNSGPHLYCHLFPRYLDDDFPGQGIDVKLTEPSPYESDEEFQWFFKKMREKLCCRCRELKV